MMAASSGDSFMISLGPTDAYSNHVTEELLNLRRDGALVDFTIHCSDKSMACHRVVLAANSRVLKAMLTSDMAEANKHEASFEYITSDLMNLILDFMYVGQLSFPAEFLGVVLEVSDYLDIPVLKSMCIEKVQEVLHSANCISWFKMAERMNLADIMESCARIMTSSFENIMELDFSEVSKLFSSVQEVDWGSEYVLEAGMAWVQHDSNMRIQHMGSILQQAKLEQCSEAVLLQQLQIYASLFELNTSLYKPFNKALLQHLEEGRWNKKSKKRRSSCSSVLAVMGGKDDVSNNLCWYLDPDTKQFVEFTKIPEIYCTDHPSICQVPFGFAVTGGMGSRICVIFDLSSKTWKRQVNMLENKCFHASICHKNVLFVIGGGPDGGGSGYVDSLQLDDYAGVWQRDQDLPLPVNHPKVASVKDVIYLLSDENSTFRCLDVANRSWNGKASPPCTTYETSMTAANNLVFLAGGKDQIFAWYTPDTDTWTTGTRSTVLHGYGALVYFEQKLFLIGGSTTEENQEVEEYDMEKKLWSPSGFQLPLSLKGSFGMVLNLNI